MLHAALLLFSEKGYHNASMQEIAAKAEFAVGTLYKFFRNKADLYKNLILEQIEEMETRCFDRVESGPVDEIERLRKYVRTKGEHFRGNLSFVRLFIEENRGASFTIHPGLNEVRARYRGFLNRLALIFEAGIASGRFRPVTSPLRMAVALDSVVNAFLLLWLEAPEAQPFPEDPDSILDIFFKGLLNPPSPGRRVTDRSPLPHPGELKC